MVLDVQETLKKVLQEYHDILPLCLEEGSRQLPERGPSISYEINLKPDFYSPLWTPLQIIRQNLKLKKNG
jgi:hypothetical protein